MGKGEISACITDAKFSRVGKLAEYRRKKKKLMIFPNYDTHHRDLME